MDGEIKLGCSCDENSIPELLFIDGTARLVCVYCGAQLILDKGPAEPPRDSQIGGGPRMSHRMRKGCTSMQEYEDIKQCIDYVTGLDWEINIKMVGENRNYVVSAASPVTGELQFIGNRAPEITLAFDSLYREMKGDTDEKGGSCQ